MSYFIIIRGPLGVGKSLISKKLAEILNAVYISIDSIIKEHGLDEVPENKRCIPVENFIEGNKIVLPKVRENLEEGKIVILDGNFYHEEQLTHLKENLSDFKHFVFTLKAPLDVCIQRDKNRENSHGESAAEAVYELVSRFDEGKIINTENKKPNEVVQEILSSLPEEFED